MKLKLHVPCTPSAFPPGSGHYDDGDGPAEKLALSGIPLKTVSVATNAALSLAAALRNSPFQKLAGLLF